MLLKLLHHTVKIQIIRKVQRRRGRFQVVNIRWNFDLGKVHRNWKSNLDFPTDRHQSFDNNNSKKAHLTQLLTFSDIKCNNQS